MTEVFISYSKDDRQHVKEVIAGLADRGVNTWWDQYVPSGVPWDEEILRQLGACEAIIVLARNGEIDVNMIAELGAARALRTKIIMVGFHDDMESKILVEQFAHHTVVGGTLETVINGICSALGKPQSSPASTRDKVPTETEIRNLAPYLRRLARTLTGDREKGDNIVIRTLEAIVADHNQFRAL